MFDVNPLLCCISPFALNRKCIITVLDKNFQQNKKYMNCKASIQGDVALHLLYLYN